MGSLTYFPSLILPNVFFYLVLSSFRLLKWIYSAFSDFATLTSVRECFAPRLLDWRAGLSRNPWEDSWYPSPETEKSLCFVVGPRLLLTAFICRRQDSGACYWTSDVSKNFCRSVQDVGEFRWELGTEILGWGRGGTQEGKQWGCNGVYSLFKMIQLCCWKTGPFFPHPWKTFSLHNTYSHKLKSWIITGFIYMSFLTLIYDMICLGLNCISFSPQQRRLLQLNKINNLFSFQIHCLV